LNVTRIIRSKSSRRFTHVFWHVKTRQVTKKQAIAPVHDIGAGLLVGGLWFYDNALLYDLKRCGQAQGSQGK